MSTTTYSVNRPLTRICAVFLTSIIVTAGQIVLAQQDYAECEGDAPVFASMDHAIHSLSHCFYQQSFDEDKEFIAALLEEDGVLTAVIQHAEPGENQVTLRFSRKPTQKLVALWHTHGSKGSARDYFSPDDTATAEQLGVPFYLTDPAGKITRY